MPQQQIISIGERVSETATSESASEVSSAGRPLWPKPRRRWFPAIWICVATLIWAGFQLSDTTRDVKYVATVIILVASTIGLAIWYLVRGRAPARRRWGLILLLIAAATAGRLAVTLENDGDGRFIGWRWSWTPSADQTLDLPVAKGVSPIAESTESAESAVAEPGTPGSIAGESYPAFLGGGYWAEAKGISLAADWQSNPPVEVWRQPIGAGWSSFAIVGGLAVTQEQRGSKELVVAYRIGDGEVAWLHADETRFDAPGPIESMGGVGPRATPAIHKDRVYTHGATGIVNCLDMRSGELLWSVNGPEKFETDVLRWGMSSSPLVISSQQHPEGMVVIAVGAPYGSDGTTDFNASLVALDPNSGEVIWSGGNRITSYASPVYTTLAGRPQILQVNQDFLTSYDPTDGTTLWEAPWPGSSHADASCSQPVPLVDDRVFVSKGYGVGSMMLEVDSSNEKVSSELLWRKNVLKTKLGNVVVKDGHAYGIDGIHLQCVDLATGKSEWKQRRRPVFGHGQILLVGEHLLILSESGELILADASPEKYQERSSLQVLDPDVVSWSNPALAGDTLLVRNSEEIVCLRMPAK